ncbi:MAG: hypothetical protein IJE91_04890 [Clostridia bacterium]|nr:hypothetical protein [Clostridia bacterium]
MAQNVVEEYYNKILHLRSAKHFLNDIFLINQTLLNFNEVEASQVISYIAIKYKTDLNQFGRMMTGVMVLNQNELPPKTEADLEYDLCYLRDCIIIFAAVHTGIENTLHSAVVKINRANKQAELELQNQNFESDGGEVYA